MKFIVMECHPGYAVVLDEEGRFRKVANMRYEVGQTLTEVTEVSVPVKRSPVRWISSFAAAAACLLMLLTPAFLIPGKAHASVYVTINPEVRIDVDRRDTVVGLEGLNEDGKLLIEGYSYRRKDLDTVIDQLVDRAIGMDLLHEGDRIALSLDTEDQEWVTAHSTSLVSQLDEYMKDKLSVIIELSCEDHHEVHIPAGERHEDDGHGHDHDDGHDDDHDDGPDDIDDDDGPDDIDDDGPDDIDDDDGTDDVDDDGPDDIDDDDGPDDIDDDDGPDDIDDGPDDIDDDDGPDDIDDDDGPDDVDDGPDDIDDDGPDDAPDEGHGGAHHGDWEDEDDPEEDEDAPEEDEDDPEEDEDDPEEDEDDPEEDEYDPEEDEDDPEEDEDAPKEDEDDPEEDEDESEEDGDDD